MCVGSDSEYSRRLMYVCVACTCVCAHGRGLKCLSQVPPRVPSTLASDCLLGRYLLGSGDSQLGWNAWPRSPYAFGTRIYWLSHLLRLTSLQFLIKLLEPKRTQSFDHLDLCFGAKENGLALTLDQMLTSLAKSPGRGRDFS